MGRGSGPPRAGVGGRDAEQDEFFGADPRIAPGLPRPIGWRVRMPDGTAAYDKFGPLDTDWVPVGTGGSGGVTQIIAGDNITISPSGGTGVVTINDKGIAAWPTGIVGIFAADAARPDNSGAGFAIPASSSAADYRTASVAAGAVAKKTIAGLAAIVPRFGAGRLLEIQIAAGAYNGDDLSALLNGITGYAAVVVRGTGTVATAGTTKFDGTAADCSTVGGQTGTGLNAAGYTTIAASNAQTLTLTKVGGAAPGLSPPNGLPLGIRARFDVATTTATDRNIARQVGRVFDVDKITVQTPFPTIPANTDTIYFEQPGVRLTGALNLTAAGTDGLTLVGLAWAGALNVDPAAGRHRFVFCTFDDAGTQTLASATGVIVAQNYAHPVYGTTTPGGGLLLQGSLTATGARMRFEGLVSQLATTLNDTDGSLLWGSGCTVRNLIINSSWASNTDDGGNQANFGMLDPTPPTNDQGPGRPTTFGAGALAAMQINGSVCRIGRMTFLSYAGKAAIALTGKCDIEFVGAPNCDSDGSGVTGLDLTNAAQCEIRVGSQVPGITGTASDITYLGPVNGAWGDLLSQDHHDANGNHIYYALAGTGQYLHRVTPSVFRATFDPGTGATVRYGLLRGCTDNAGTVEAASNANVTDAQMLVGTAESAAGAGFPVGMYVRPLTGCSLCPFVENLTSAATGKVAYLSATLGLATINPPTTGPIIPIGVVVEGTGITSVVAWGAAIGTMASRVESIPGLLTLLAMYDADNIDGSNNSTLTPGQRIDTWKNVCPTVPGGISLGAAADLLQATAGLRPQYLATGGPHGRAIVDFDGARYMATAAFAAKGGPFTVLVVWKPANLTGTQVIYGGNTGFLPMLFVDNTGQLSMYDGATANAGNIAAGNWYSHIGEHNAAASSYNLCGTEPAAAINPASGTMDGFFVGANSAGANILTAPVKLILLYQGKLVNRGQIDQYRTARVGVLPQ
jgi:hypothetical protein